MFYKGYIPTKDKKSIQKFKNMPQSSFLTLEQAQELPEYAGVLDDDTILIDLDDRAEAEKLMNIVEALQINCRVYQTTRGKHFLFKNSGVDKCGARVLACGLHADIKVGSKNSYEVIKYNGKDRFIEWEVDGEEADPLPKWLYPVKSCPDFLNMQDGDGRNQKLFGYILGLQGAGFTVDESREILGIINKYIFEKPLDERELEIITRDEAFNKPVFFDDEKGFLFDEFAKWLIANEHILRINGVLHIYANGLYKAGRTAIERAMIKHIPNLRAAQRAEVWKYIDTVVEPYKVRNNSQYIAFTNGIYDLSTGEMRDFTPDIVITNGIPHAYNQAAESDIVDTVMGKLSLGDENIKKLLAECVGYCMYRSNDIAGGKAFILTGDKANGKSTFLDCFVGNVLGEENTSALDLSEIGDRFSTSSLFDMLANIGDDISDEFLAGRQVAIFKKIVTGERIKGEEKGEKEFFFKPYTKLLFSANTIPRIRDRTGAVIRRLVIVPFKAMFSKNDPDYDPFIKQKLYTESAAEYIIKLAIEGLHRVLNNNEFTECEAAQTELTSYEEENNPFKAWLNEHGEEEVVNEEASIIYHRYTIFCSENQTQPMSRIGFTRNLCRELGINVKIITANGKRVKIFSR